MDWFLSAVVSLGLWAGPPLPEYRDTCPPLSVQDRANIRKSFRVEGDAPNPLADAGDAFGQRLCQALEKRFQGVLQETWGQTPVSIRRECIARTRTGAAELGQPQGYVLLGSCVAFMKSAARRK
jgi:hypothetical protein